MRNRNSARNVRLWPQHQQTLGPGELPYDSGNFFSASSHPLLRPGPNPNVSLLPQERCLLPFSLREPSFSVQFQRCFSLPQEPEPETREWDLGLRFPPGGFAALWPVHKITPERAENIPVLSLPSPPSPRVPSILGS